MYQSLKEKWQLRRKRKKRQKERPLPYSINPPVELFDSIKNLVMDKWDDIHETGNYFILSQTKTQDKTRRLFNYCVDTWDDINEQWATKFGMSSTFKEYWAKKAEVAELKINYALSQDNWDLTLINLAKDELESLKPKGKPDSMTDSLLIEKETGIKLNLQTDSVDRFYSASKVYQKLGANG